MPDALTDEEREFLWNYRGSIGDILAGVGGAPERARTAATGIIDVLMERYPSRTERLLVYAALAEATTSARNAVLTEILETEFHWVEVLPGDWRSAAWQPLDIQALAALSGLAVETVRRRLKTAIANTLEAAKAAAEPCPEDPDGVHHVGCGCVS